MGVMKVDGVHGYYIIIYNYLHINTSMYACQEQYLQAVNCQAHECIHFDADFKVEPNIVFITTCHANSQIFALALYCQ